jgi:phosphate transport system permease protein
MQTYVVFIVLLLLTYSGFRLGRNRAVAASGGELNKLHSLPSYHGLYVAIWCGIPSTFLVALWVALEPAIITSLVVSELPTHLRSVPDARLNLLLNDIRILPPETSPAAIQIQPSTPQQSATMRS